MSPFPPADLPLATLTPTLTSILDTAKIKSGISLVPLPYPSQGLMLNKVSGIHLGVELGWHYS